MNQTEALKQLRYCDTIGKYTFNINDLAKVFPDDNKKTLMESIYRLTKADILKRACRGVYVNEYARSFNSYAIEQIAKTIRRGHFNYVSLESILSEYGVISQIPIDRLTVMTTGRSGTYNTPYGTIEFTHTKRSVKNIISNTLTVEGRPLRIATEQAAIRDLKRVGRNTHLLNEEA